MKNCLYIALIMLLGMPASWAQPTTGRQPTEKLETIANDNLSKYDTWNALDYYKQVQERKAGDPKATYDVAYTYYLLRDYPSAEAEFKRMLEEDKDGNFQLGRWFYAYNLKLNGKYAECIPEFEKFISAYTGDQAETLKKLAQVEIDGAKWAQQVTEPYEELKIENVGKTINSPLMENYAFPIGRNKMVFSSLRSDTIILVEEAEEDDKFAKLYVVEREESEDPNVLGEWKDATLFNPEVLKKEEVHAVNPAFNREMTSFYFSRARLTGNMLENSKIYSCTYDGTTTGDPLVLDFNDNTYSCKNPAVATIDGKEYLIFASNMPGGQGGFDLWIAEINEDGTTMQPLNLGDAVNTVGEESYPFFDERDQTLYFASTGHPGMGGVDMFSVVREKSGNWGKVENMGPGYNTSVDEFGFNITRVDKDDCYGYFISNREGTSSVRGKTSTDDIYSILMPERCDVEVDICVKNQENGQEIKGATVQLIDKSTGKVVEEQTNTESCNFHFTLEQGKEYNVVAKKDGWESGATTTVDARRPALEERFGSIDNPMAWNEETTLKELGLIVETFNSKTQEALSGVTVIVYNSKTNEKVNEMTMTAGNRFEFKIPRNSDYRIQARLEGFVGESKEVAVAQMGQMQKLYLTPPPIFVNVLFDFDKSNIREGAADTLNQVAKILTDYPSMVVEVRGHTDSRGANAYNDRLSNRRSTAAMKYLIDKGIAEERMIPKGFGENEPIAPNETEDGQDDPAGRQLNRRVEFKIIKGEGASSDADNSTSDAGNEEKKNQ